jgi:hypothetical protein
MISGGRLAEPLAERKAHPMPEDLAGHRDGDDGAGAVRHKLTVEQLGIELADQDWQRSGLGEGSLEVAFIRSVTSGSDVWVLLRVAGDPAGRVLVYDRTEWECFVDGAARGEFDDAAELAR